MASSSVEYAPPTGCSNMETCLHMTQKWLDAETDIFCEVTTATCRVIADAWLKRAIELEAASV